MPGQRRPPVQLLHTGDDLTRVQTLVEPLMLDDAQVERVLHTLQQEMEHGLHREPAQRALTSLQMENTYVRSLLDGTEIGDFLALDLGGTNFRVLLCEMHAGKCESISRNYNVPTAKLKGPVQGVFDHLADSIYQFLESTNKLDQRLPLGFTFSFPMMQRGLKSGVLVTWTKSFACPDGVGQDAVVLLEEALARKGGMLVDVVAVLNDTTGTLLAGSYLDKQCGIGLIMGTGCNAAYVERVENVDKWDGDPTDTGDVIIDIEWGAFGDNGSLDFTKTEYDGDIDLHSNHVGSFTFEKLFSGHYVGDLVRLCLVRLAGEGLVFSGTVPPALREWGSVTASHISHIAGDTDAACPHTVSLLTALGVVAPSPADTALVRYLCGAVTLRGAQLISASLAALLRRMQWAEMTVAIDGSLYRYHPHYHRLMTDWIAELAPKTKCKLILAEDGSGRGAAFVAAVSAKSS